MRRSPHAAVAAALALLLAAGPGRADERGAAGGAGPPESPGPDLALAPPSGPPPRPHLTIDLPAHAAATGGLLLLIGASVLATDRLAAPACRWCEPNPLDRWARRELRWTDTRSAETTANLMVDALPVGAVLTLALAARADGAGKREVAEDLLVVTEAVSVAMLLTQTSKFAVGRLRPDAWASGSRSSDGVLSFWGGHAAFAFAVAAGATQVARLRDRPGWKWLALVSFASAAATGWLRVAGDRHWLTDVVVGAGVGTAAGLAIPLLVLHPAGGRAAAVTLAPAPGGFALLF